MTTQLEEALKGYPLYSQDGKGKDAICRAIFALGGVRWFILEGEKEGNNTILFGIVIGLMEDEYGYISTQLEEALKGYPLYSQAGKGKDAICRAIFALGGVRWFILEGEKEGNNTILFGIVIGLMEDEYGYISLNELSEIELDLTRQGFGKLQVRQQEDFQPTPLKKLRDSRLQEFLARMGY